MTDLLSERRPLRTSPAPLHASDLSPLVAAIADGDVVAAMEVASRLATRARHTVADRHLMDRLDLLVNAGGAGALAAIEVLGALLGTDAEDRLVALVEDHRRSLRRHAIWRLGERPLCRRAIPSLVHELQRGGIDTFHAHRTLRTWSAADPTSVLRTATTALAVTDDSASRARLIDLIGAVDDRGTDAYLVDLAVDGAEPEAARIAAIGALGERRSTMITDALSALAASDDVFGAHAAVALEAGTPMPRTAPHGLLRVAQLVLTEGLDGGLSRGGRGDTGGVASLLVSLADALVARPSVGRVVTIGHGTVFEALLEPFAEGSNTFGTIALGDPDRPVRASADAWEHLPAIERGLRRSIRLAGGIDVLHLRMADAATLVGFEVAADTGIATCFSLAPDPHHLLESLRGRGELDPQAFDDLESDQHIWFRARLIERVGRSAERLALFPQTSTFEFMDRIGAVDGSREPGRSATIAEGIDLALIRQVESASRGATGAVDELDRRLPASRRGRPLLVTVGRLHPVKGIDRVADAWSRHPLLRDHCNLVIVGGDLEDPSPVEGRVIEAVDRIIGQNPSCADGIVMLGGRPHAEVAELLVSAAAGRSGAWPPGGVYVDGAAKEEFGLAVLEAMAAGLPVVAPSTGGPATYVADGDTGVLARPGDDLSEAIVEGFALVDRPGRADRARALIEADYSIDSMAAGLADLYQGCAR